MHVFLKRYIKYKNYLKAYTFLHCTNESWGEEFNLHLGEKNGDTQSNGYLIIWSQLLRINWPKYGIEAQHSNEIYNMDIKWESCNGTYKSYMLQQIIDVTIKSIKYLRNFSYGKTDFFPTKLGQVGR